MTIRTNKILDRLLEQLNIKYDTVNFEFPKELETVLSGEVVESNECITLATLTPDPYFSSDVIDKIGVQDFTNHFHPEDYGSEVDTNDLKSVVSLGLTVLKSLVNKFKNANQSKIVISGSFETKELGKKLEMDLGINDEDEHYNSCRISFYKNPNADLVTTNNLEAYKYNGIMIVQL